MNKKRQGDNGKVGSTLEDRKVQDISRAQDRPRQGKVGSWLILEDRAGHAFVRLWRIKRLLALVMQVIAHIKACLIKSATFHLQLSQFLIDSCLCSQPVFIM